MINNNVLVSVIVPVFNAGEYLHACLESIQKQSYQNIEIIVVDDGSTDNSGSIADSLALEDSRIIVFHNNNSGVSKSRNFGLKQSRGVFISFIDSDDWVEPTFIEQLLEPCLDGSIDFSWCDLGLEEKSGRSYYHTWNSCSDYKESLHAMLRDGWGGVSVNKLYRKQFLIDSRIAYPETIIYCEDLLFSTEILLHTNRFIKINQPLYIYNRKNTSSATQTFNIAKETSGFSCLDIITQELKNKGIWTEYSKEIYWRYLLNKIGIVFDKTRLHEFNTIYPEANNYIWDNPFLHPKLQLFMTLLKYRQYWIVKLALSLYKRSK